MNLNFKPINSENDMPELGKWCVILCQKEDGEDDAARLPYIVNAYLTVRDNNNTLEKVFVDYHGAPLKSVKAWAEIPNKISF